MLLQISEVDLRPVPETMKRVVLTVLCPLVVLAFVTWLSLESGGVVTVRTRDLDGAIRSTHVWFVRLESGELLLEAGHPDNPWVRDLRNGSTLEIQGESIDGVYAFEVRRGPEAHSTIRRSMREKYGWRDWWVGMLFDTSKSQLVELLSPTANEDVSAAPGRRTRAILR